MEKISAVYQIINTITGEYYIGSSKDVKRRWLIHTYFNYWVNKTTNKLYKDMQKYGLDKFDFVILKEAEPEHLREEEQKYIKLLKPTYNIKYAKGWDTEKLKKYHKEYMEKYNKEYQHSSKYKEYNKKYRQSEKGKETRRKNDKKYNSQLCLYKGETLTLCALTTRFRKVGIKHSTVEAKQYIIK